MCSYRLRVSISVLPVETDNFRPMRYNRWKLIRFFRREISLKFYKIIYYFRNSLWIINKFLYMCYDHSCVAQKPFLSTFSVQLEHDLTLINVNSKKSSKNITFYLWLHVIKRARYYAFIGLFMHLRKDF